MQTEKVTGVTKIISARRPVGLDEYPVDLTQLRAWHVDEDDSGEDGGDTENRDGSGGNVEIDWSKVDVTKIPDDVLKKTPAYQKVLDESIQRRKKLNAKKQTPENKKVTKPDPVDEEDADEDGDEVSELRQIVHELREERMVELRVRAAEKFGLNPDNKYHMRLIEGSNLQEMMASAKEAAEGLGINADSGKEKRRPDGTKIPGNPGGAEDRKEMSKRIRDRLTGSEALNPFDPGQQRMTGGGSFINNFGDDD